MATYKEIHGVKVQYRDSDATAIEGDVWYNASTGKLKMYSAVGAWASGTAINTGRAGGVGQGTTTAALFEGGGPADTESWDGSSWTEVANLNTARAENSGAGTQTAALFFGGKPSPGYTEIWNGASWTEVADLTTGRYVQAGFGTTTAAMCVAGEVSDAVSAVSETWNGASWTEGADLNTARVGQTGFGTTAAAICASGGEPAYNANVESWDGSSWTEVGNQNTGRKDCQQGGFGTQSGGMVYGGNQPAPVGALVEEWNGSGWTEVANLSAVVRIMGGAGTTNASALSIGGAPGTKTAVEVWTSAASVQTVAFD